MSRELDLLTLCAKGMRRHWWRFLSAVALFFVLWIGWRYGSVRTKPDATFGTTQGNGTLAGGFPSDEGPWDSINKPTRWAAVTDISVTGREQPVTFNICGIRTPTRYRRL
jgi:hypothetical protein